jgi:glucose-1-phosphate cytidylyltransferase
MKNTETPIFILCGGLGTRIKEETEYRPKPMVPLGRYPILWHIMKTYHHHGFKRFILCLGFKAEIIKEYFFNYSSMNSDFTVELAENSVHVHSVEHAEDWTVTLTDTGEETMTGARIAIAAKKYLGDSEHFGVTYGDGLTDANLDQEFEYHCNHGRIGTILGINPPSRFGEIILNQNEVIAFTEKPDLMTTWINGGYFFFQKDFLNYFSKDSNCILEREPLMKLAKEKQLMLFKHEKFWACMDTQRDREYLNSLLQEGSAPWIQW